MELTLTVAPVEGGWTLKSSDIDLDLAFASGRQAEAQGREFASRLARTGRHVELEIILRDGSLAATIPYGPALAA